MTADVLWWETPGAIDRAVTLLRTGKPVALPTETVYGLAVDATNPAAVQKVFGVKGRPSHDPLIVHVADAAAARRLWTTTPPFLKELADAFWPGPLTLVHESAPGTVAPAVTAQLSTVAVRVPSHPAFRAVLEALPFPLAAPSANPFGGISPTTAGHVAHGLGQRLPLILDGGPCHKGLESTVLRLTPAPTILRLGALTQETIESVVGPVAVQTSSSRPASPGQLTRHYAPRTPLILVSSLRDLPETPSGAALLLCGPSGEAMEGLDKYHIETLSLDGNLEEAASHLYQALHKLDQGDFEVIYALQPSLSGLGKAINDRLKRASKVENHNT